MASGRRRRNVVAGALALCALALTACGGGGSSSSATTTTTTAITGTTGPSTTVWLCRPGAVPDPCTYTLDVTSVPASGSRTVRDVPDATDPTFDCFYVYPTVSTETGANADLTVQSAEVGAAVSQAAPFSQVCRVWAPMYRQRTVSSLAKGLGADPTAAAVAYASLLAGWKDYLANDNDGRPVIFIGHSQGAAILIDLLASQVDDDPALRGRMVSAILAGGNVQVPTGGVVGATFHHLPLCTSTAQTGCIIAYSSFPGQPPADSLFGRPGQGVSVQSGQTTSVGQQVACVNPAAIGGGTADLQPWFITATVKSPAPPVTTPWVTYPGLYSATCATGGGATWLQVDDLAGPGDDRPVVTERLGPTWGYHLDDINLASGNLVADVALEEQAYTAAHG